MMIRHEGDGEDVKHREDVLCLQSVVLHDAGKVVDQKLHEGLDVHVVGAIERGACREQGGQLAPTGLISNLDYNFKISTQRRRNCKKSATMVSAVAMASARAMLHPGPVVSSASMTTWQTKLIEHSWKHFSPEDIHRSPIWPRVVRSWRQIQKQGGGNEAASRLTKSRGRSRQKSPWV